MKRILPLLLALLPVVAAAEPPCPCVPKETTWIATFCDTWNCAASALVLDNGQASVMAVPTSSDAYRWVVLRRVASGSVTASPDEPFDVESFANASDGAGRIALIEAIRAPMLVTTPDGRTLVVALKPEVAAAAAHRRSVGH